MTGVSRLRGGNQAKKAQRFKVSVFGSHVGPGSAKTDSFLCPPPTSSLTGVVAGTGIAQSCASVVCSSGTGSGELKGLSKSETCSPAFVLSLVLDLRTTATFASLLMCGSGLRWVSCKVATLRRVRWPEESVQFQNNEMKGGRWFLLESEGRSSLDIPLA